MNVKEFVEGYKKVEDKQKFVVSHIRRQYVPYTEKMAICKMACQIGMHEKIQNENGKDIGEIFKVNSPRCQMLYTTYVIMAYTDIEFDVDDAVKELETLEENDLVDIITACISEADLDRFNMIYEMTMEDTYRNEFSTAAFLQSIGTGFINALKTEINKMKESGDFE